MNAPDTKQPSMALQLVDLALEEWELIASEEGRPYAVPCEGPRLAVPIDGGRSSMRSALADLYFAETGKVPSRNALAEAMEVLRGRALGAEREPVMLRHASQRQEASGHRNWRTVRLIDLGDDTGEAVALIGGGAAISPKPVIAFRRTELTAAFPRPMAGVPDRHYLAELRGLLNVTIDGWHLLVGWIVAVLLGDVAVPILYLNGEQGTGKTTIARRVVALTDPSTVPVRSAPKDVESWVVTANGSRVIALDNLSSIPGWFSDALCRAVTGDGLVRRALYTDDELAVTTFRRAVILTSIDAGAIAGDLGERLLPLDLERIADRQRTADSDLDAAFAAVYPGAFSMLLDLAARVAERLDDRDVPDAELPRMAEFARVLLVLDDIRGTDSFDAYRTVVADVFRDLVHGDPLAEAICAVARAAGPHGWNGTPADLAKAIEPHRPEDRRAAWPKTPRGVSGAVRRLAPSLRVVGVDVVLPTRTGQARRIELHFRDGSDGCDGRSSVAASRKEKEESPPDQSADSDQPSQPSQPSSPPSSAPCSRCTTPTTLRNYRHEPRCTRCFAAEAGR